MLQRAFRILRGNAIRGAQTRALFDPKHLALNRHRRPSFPCDMYTPPLKIGFIRLCVRGKARLTMTFHAK